MKETIGDLAILGGSPQFQNLLHVGTPNIGDREAFQKRMDDILDRRWLTNQGKYVAEFEQKVSNFLGVKHCIAMCNGTVALEIAIRALGMRGEVIVPSFTFVATAHALQWQEIAPVFCDIDPLTHTIDPAKVESLITPKTTGIIGVHIWGRPCNVEALTDIAQRRGLKLMFDAAPAFGCSHRGRMIGGFGDAEVFSFHATKVLNTFEGGAVLTNNDELARKIRLMKNFGFTNFDQVDYIGINGKMSEVSAAMGLTGLDSMDEFISKNRDNYELYIRELNGVKGVSVIQYDPAEKNNYHYIVIEIDEKVSGVSRDVLHKILRAENVLARRYFYPGCHRMEPYKSCYPWAGLLLPETERLTTRVLCLPSGTLLRDEAIRGVCSILRIAVQDSARVCRLIKEG